MEIILFVLTFWRWYLMRKSHPDGESIIHIFFRDGMIYFAVIFGAVGLLVCEPGITCTDIHWQPWPLGPCSRTSALRSAWWARRSSMSSRIHFYYYSVLTPLKPELHFYHALCMPVNPVHSLSAPILNNPIVRNRNPIRQ